MESILRALVEYSGLMETETENLNALLDASGALALDYVMRTRKPEEHLVRDLLQSKSNLVSNAKARSAKMLEVVRLLQNHDMTKPRPRRVNLKKKAK